MYRTKRIKTNEDVQDVEAGVFAGSPACSSTDKHYPRGTSRHYRWQAEPLPTPAATGVFVEYTGSSKQVPEYVALLCPEHGAPIKSSLTRGSWSNSDVEFFPDVKPEDVARDVEGWLVRLAADKKREKETREQEVAAAELARVRENWSAKRRDYNAPVGDPAFHKYVVNESGPNEFGLIHVTTIRADMTPNEAREYARRLIEAAGRAEDKSALARRP